MKIDVPDTPKKPSVWNLKYLGPLISVVGLAKLGDVLFLTAPDHPLRTGQLFASVLVFAVGLIMMAFYKMQSRPATESKAIELIRAQREKRQSEKNNSAEAGFTLIEVVITIAIVALIFGMVGGVLFSVVNVSEKINERFEEEKIGHGVLALIQRDLSGCACYGLGKVVFKGDDKSQSGREGDEIFFITTTPGDAFNGDQNNNNNGNAGGFSNNPNINSNNQFNNQNGAQNGQPGSQNAAVRRGPQYRKVSYVLRPSPSADRSAGEERFVLCRRASELTSEDRDATTGAGPYVEVVDGLLSFKLEYKDTPEGAWRDGWTDTATVPAAVRFTVETVVPFKRVASARADGLPDPQPRRFQSVVSLLAKGRLLDPNATTTTSTPR